MEMYIMKQTNYFSTFYVMIYELFLICYILPHFPKLYLKYSLINPFFYGKYTITKFPSIGDSHIGRNVVTKPEAQNTFLALHKQRQQRRRRLRRHGTGLWVENRKADKTKTGRTGKSGRNVKKWTEEHEESQRGRQRGGEREREEATEKKRVLPTQHRQQQQLLCCPAPPLPPHRT